MKVGIYIDGLAQSVAQESVVKYATRFKNEYCFHNDGNEYDTKVEKIVYGNQKLESNVVSIIQKNGDTEKVLYKFYGFKYGDILTGEFTKKNILIKNLILLGVVMRKFPVLLKRMFKSGGYNNPFQTYYLFTIFFVIAFAVFLMIPTITSVISNLLIDKSVIEFGKEHPTFVKTIHGMGITRASFTHFSQYFVSIISIILVVMPGVNTVITSLATEFVCAHLYLQFGKQKQDVLGNIDQLFEYIVEHEKDSKIHFHSYSFGTLVAMDYLYAFGKTPSGNVVEKTEALVTIGSPFEFVNAYYSNYYKSRSAAVEQSMKHWINLYSISDALSSNFRFDSKLGDAQYGIVKGGLKPFNINYEVVYLSRYSLSNFISLTNVKMHGMYWTTNTDGQSCLAPIYDEMKKQALLE